MLNEAEDRRKLKYCLTGLEATTIEEISDDEHHKHGWTTLIIVLANHHLRNLAKDCPFALLV